MTGREADRARIRVEVVEPQVASVSDQRAEDAAAARKLPDRSPRLVVDAVGDEALQVRAARVDHAQRDVSRLRQVGGALDDPLQQVVQRQLGIQGDAGIDHPMQTLRIRARGQLLSLLLRLRHDARP